MLFLMSVLKELLRAIILKICQEICNFTTEEISNLTGTRLIPELVLHKHSQKVLKRTKNQKSIFMTIAERKQELILHYNVHHNN